MRTDPTPEARNKNADDRSSPVTWRRELRRQAINRRMALSGEEYAQRSHVICVHLQAHFPQLAALRVGFCWPMKNEPDLLPLLAAWQTGGHSTFAALLPVVVAADAPLAFRAWTPDTPMVEDRYGIPTPATGAFSRPQALLIPLVAFDSAGYRLGYGGGFFDRTLTSLQPRPLAIGVGFELCRVDTIRPEPHDQRLDAVATEAGVFTFA